MTITITAFERSPDGGKGLARDTRVRWALEEAGQPYDVRLVSFAEMKAPAHLAIHPFGQIPTYEEGDLALFETGAIVFHIAQRFPGLLPDDADARARAVTWMFAALSTVEPPILELVTVRFVEGDKPWLGEGGRGPEVLVRLDHPPAASGLMAAVAAIAIGVIFADQFRIALAQRVRSASISSVERAQRSRSLPDSGLPSLRSARSFIRSRKRAPIASSGSEIGPARRTVGAAGALNARVSRSQPAKGRCASWISSGLMPLKKL
jgi:hypothetical protein